MTTADRPVAWIGQRGEDSDCLTSLGRLAAVLCCDWSERLGRMGESLPVTSLERDSAVREVWSSASLESLDDELVIRALEAARSSGKGLVVVPYRAISSLERVTARVAGGRVVLAAPPAGLVDELDDKLRQRRLLGEWGLPTPRWLAALPSALSRSIAESSGQEYPVVVQRARGSLGRGTRRFDTRAELERAVPGWSGDAELLASEHISGPVVNVNAVTSSSGVHVAWPSVQLVGLAAAGAFGTYLYCGNDYAAARVLAKETLRSVEELTRLIGRGLASRSYRGLFGVDFMLRDGEALALEINPRFQGSTALLAALERASGRKPTVALHLECFGEEGAPLDSSLAHAPAPLNGAEVVLYSRDRAVSTSPGQHLDAESQRGFPRPGTRLVPGACLGRMRFPNTVLRGDLASLAPAIESRIERTRREILGQP